MEAAPIRVVQVGHGPAIVERLPRGLPNWFGIEESIAEFVADAAKLPTYLAYGPGDVEAVGVLLVSRHFPEAAEIHLMAVAPAFHRRGVGRAMLEAAEKDLQSEGVRLVQVKTQGPSRPDEGYERTLKFYLAHGFTRWKRSTDCGLGIHA